ncbi:hypothetical protein NECID01_2174 [Nematocida sp. AWRm77]|nr:hypothetical protein NECID01_2174 [Nematocida sp. AWRm77]
MCLLCPLLLLSSSLRMPSLPSASTQLPGSALLCSALQMFASSALLCPLMLHFFSAACASTPALGFFSRTALLRVFLPLFTPAHQCRLCCSSSLLFPASHAHCPCPQRVFTACACSVLHAPALFFSACACTVSSHALLQSTALLHIFAAACACSVLPVLPSSVLPVSAHFLLVSCVPAPCVSFPCMCLLCTACTATASSSLHVVPVSARPSRILFLFLCLCMCLHSRCAPCTSASPLLLPLLHTSTAHLRVGYAVSSTSAHCRTCTLYLHLHLCQLFPFLLVLLLLSSWMQSFSLFVRLGTRQVFTCTSHNRVWFYASHNRVRIVRCTLYSACLCTCTCPSNACTAR